MLPGYYKQRKLKRAKKRFNKAISQATPSASKPKKGRPSRKSDTVTVSTVREKPIIICQKIGGQLHKVETKENSQKMLQVSQKLPDKGMYRRLNSPVCPGDAIANDLLYHNLCWATVKKKAEAPQKTVYNSKEIIHTVSEIELINLIESELNDSSHQILDMNKVNIL